MKEHKKNITSSDVLEMMIRAGLKLKPATESELLHLHRTTEGDSDTAAEDDDFSSRKGREKKIRVA